MSLFLHFKDYFTSNNWDERSLSSFRVEKTIPCRWGPFFLFKIARLNQMFEYSRERLYTFQHFPLSQQTAFSNVSTDHRQTVGAAKRGNQTIIRFRFHQSTIDVATINRPTAVDIFGKLFRYNRCACLHKVKYLPANRRREGGVYHACPLKLFALLY